jgi:tetratricopeptide (TPR) repeat protein
MRHWIVGLLIIMGLGMLPAAVPHGFHTTWPAVQKAAKAANKPIYLHFTTTWCGWCRKIENETYTDAKAKAALAMYACATLDCTVPRDGAPSEAVKTNLSLYRKYGGDGYPFLVMVTPEGDLLHTIDGYVPPDALVKELATGTALLKEYRAFQAYAATADKTTLDYHIRAMQLYSKLGQLDNAAKSAVRVIEWDPENAKGQALPANLLLLESVPPTGWPDKAQPYLTRIIQLDPDNAQGKMQEAMMLGANCYFARAQSTRDATARNTLFQHCVDLYTELTTRAKTLNDPQMVYAMLGFLHLKMQHRDDAIANLKKALALDPTSRVADQIKELIEQAEGMK